MGQQPKIRLYFRRPKESDVKLDYKRDDMGALWENTKDDGTVYYTGNVRVGPDKRINVVGFVNTKADEEPSTAAGPFDDPDIDQSQDDDIPF